MKHKLGTALVLLGLVLILAAGALVAYNAWESNRAAERSAAALEQVSRFTRQQTQSPLAAPQLNVLPVVELDGVEYIGTLSIPRLSLRLPVQADWSMEGLKSAPCRYSGDLHTGDLVIAGHSYRSHFGSLAGLQPGDAVIFTAMDGTEYTFQVALVEVLRPWQTQAMTAGDYPLTLFTCTKDSQNRTTLRCTHAPLS